MGLFSAIGDYQAKKGATKGLKESLAYQQGERRRGQERGEELYGEYTPAGGMGMDALQKQYDVMVGGDQSQFQESPGYQFALEQGTQASERGAAAKGGLMGGGQMKELTRLGQGYANQEFGNWLSQMQGFTDQATGIGMGASREIMGQYGGVSPGQIGSTMASLGQAKGLQKQSPWQAGQEMQDEAVQAIVAAMTGKPPTSMGQNKGVVGPYGPQQPTGVR